MENTSIKSQQHKLNKSVSLRLNPCKNLVLALWLPDKSVLAKIFACNATTMRDAIT